MANEAISVIQDEFKPLPRGRVRTYELLGLRMDPESKGFVCPQSRRIANKFLVNDKKGVKDNVKSFVFVSNHAPTIESGSLTANQLGGIVFTREGRGRIIISGDKPENIELDKALFFHQQNISNIDKPWHVRPRTGQYVFRLLDPKAKAEFDNKNFERRNTCENIISDMKVALMRDTYEMLFKQDSEGFDSPVVRNKLYKYVQEDANAQNFLVLNSSEQMKAKVIIRDAYDKKFIMKDDKTVRWVNGKELICQKLPRKNMDQSFLIFLVTDDGKDVLKTLKDLTEAKQ